MSSSLVSIELYQERPKATVRPKEGISEKPYMAASSPKISSFLQALDIGDNRVRLTRSEYDIRHSAVGVVENEIQGCFGHSGSRCDRDEGRCIPIRRENFSRPDGMAFGADLPRQVPAPLLSAELLCLNVLGRHRQSNDREAQMYQAHVLLHCPTSPSKIQDFRLKGPFAVVKIFRARPYRCSRSTRARCPAASMETSSRGPILQACLASVRLAVE